MFTLKLRAKLHLGFYKELKFALQILVGKTEL